MKLFVLSFLCYSSATGFLLEIQSEQDKMYFNSTISVSGKVIQEGIIRSKLEYVACQFNNVSMICNITREVLFMNVLYGDDDFNDLIKQSCGIEKKSWILTNDNEINVDIFMINQINIEKRLTSGMFNMFPRQKELSFGPQCWKLCSYADNTICISVKVASITSFYSYLIVSAIILFIMLSVVLILVSLRCLCLKYIK